MFAGNGLLLILEALSRTSLVSSTLPMANNHLGDSGMNLLIYIIIVVCYHTPIYNNIYYVYSPMQNQEKYSGQRNTPLQQPPSSTYVGNAGNNYIAHRNREQIKYPGNCQPFAANQFHACEQYNIIDRNMFEVLRSRA